jgi:hypothetical protein
MYVSAQGQKKAAEKMAKVINTKEIFEKSP